MKYLRSEITVNIACFLQQKIFNFIPQIRHTSKNKSSKPESLVLYKLRLSIVIFINRHTMAVRCRNTVYPTHENWVCPFFSEHLFPPEVVKGDRDDVELSKMIRDNEAWGTSTDALDRPIRRISIPQLIDPADTKSVFDSTSKLVNNSDYDVVDSVTTFICSLDQLILKTMAHKIQMKDLNKNESKFYGRHNVGRNWQYFQKQCIYSCAKVNLGSELWNTAAKRGFANQIQFWRLIKYSVLSPFSQHTQYLSPQTLCFRKWSSNCSKNDKSSFSNWT